MFKKTLAALAAVLLGVGLSVAAVAAPASAHTGDLSASAECVNGEYKVTYTLKIAQTDLKGTSWWRIGTSKFDGTPSNNNGMSNSVATNGSGSYVLTTITLPGNSTSAPWAYAYSTWPNFAKGSDGGNITLGGNCSTQVTVKTAPYVTDPTCLVGGHLVIPENKGVTFTGGTDGASVPKTYNLVAEAKSGYTLTGQTKWDLTVKPADATKCTIDPKTNVDVSVCTPTHDNKSQKTTKFWFDNSASQAAVTFTIPTLNITQVVAAGAKVSVDGPKVDHNVGGSWEVLANGKPLKTLTVEKFAPCLTTITPGDPSSTDQKCVGGKFTLGSITVVPNVGKIVFVITGGTIQAPGITVPDNNPVTTLPAGKYTVTAHGINGNTVGPENTWTYPIVIGGPVNCDLPTHALLKPTASQNNGSCTADPTYTLSNTTSENGGVQWWIGDPQVKTTPGTHKASWGSTVVVEATLVNSVADGFEKDAQTEYTFKFPAKPACGDLLTLALTGSSTGGFVPLIAGVLLLLGGAGIYFTRRLVATSK